MPASYTPPAPKEVLCNMQASYTPLAPKEFLCNMPASYTPPAPKEALCNMPASYTPLAPLEVLCNMPASYRPPAPKEVLCNMPASYTPPAAFYTDPTHRRPQWQRKREGRPWRAPSRARNTRWERTRGRSSSEEQEEGRRKRGRAARGRPLAPTSANTYNMQISNSSNYVLPLIHACFCNMFKHSLRIIIFPQEKNPQLARGPASQGTRAACPCCAAAPAWQATRAACPCAACEAAPWHAQHAGAPPGKDGHPQQEAPLGALGGTSSASGRGMALSMPELDAWPGR